jgi:hypothetical protein
MKLTATAEELLPQSLERFDLLRIDKAFRSCWKSASPIITVIMRSNATVTADVVQACIATLAEVMDHLEFEFKLSSG